MTAAGGRRADAQGAGRLRSGLLLSGLLLSGSAACTTVEANLAVLVPDGVDPAAVDLRRVAEGVSVTGRDRTSFLFVVPLGRLTLAEAVRDAIGRRDDVVLVDVVVERDTWWAVLFGQATLRVQGVMVPLPRGDRAGRAPAGGGDS